MHAAEAAQAVPGQGGPVPPVVRPGGEAAVAVPLEALGGQTPGWPGRLWTEWALRAFGLLDLRRAGQLCALFNRGR